MSLPCDCDRLRTSTRQRSVMGISAALTHWRRCATAMRLQRSRRCSGVQCAVAGAYKALWTNFKCTGTQQLPRSPAAAASGGSEAATAATSGSAGQPCTSACERGCVLGKRAVGCSTRSQRSQWKVPRIPCSCEHASLQLQGSINVVQPSPPAARGRGGARPECYLVTALHTARCSIQTRKLKATLITAATFLTPILLRYFPPATRGRGGAPPRVPATARARPAPPCAPRRRRRPLRCGAQTRQTARRAVVRVGARACVGGAAVVLRPQILHLHSCLSIRLPAPCHAGRPAACHAQRAPQAVS